MFEINGQFEICVIVFMKGQCAQEIREIVQCVCLINWSTLFARLIS